MSKRYSVFLPHLIYLSDIVLLNISVSIGNYVQGNINFTVSEINFILVLNLCWSISSALTGCFKIKRPLTIGGLFANSTSALIYLLLAVLGILHFVNFPQVNNADLAITYALFSLLMLAARSILYFVLDHIRRAGYNNRRILIIGNREIANRTLESLKNHPEYGYYVVDCIEESVWDEFSLKKICDVLTRHDLNEIFVCYREINHKFLNGLLDIAEAKFIKVKVISDLFLENKYARLVDYEHLPALYITSQPEIPLKVLAVKRTFDILFSTAVMTLGAPVFVILYFITKASSKGPAFYRQQRVGKNGRPFYIYKFRSMYVDAEAMGPQLSSDNDQRITKWGRVMRKSRLDELPQFWNVLKGDMSVVGPRPERLHFMEKIIERKPVYRHLLAIKPGLTSMGQVGYGYAENIDQLCDRVGYDIPYLQNMNMNADISIILKTIGVMVQFKGK